MDRQQQTEIYRTEVGYVYCTPSGSGCGTQAMSDIYRAMDEEECWSLVWSTTVGKMKAKATGNWQQSDDEIFREFHSYIIHCLAEIRPQDGIAMWEALYPEIKETQAVLDNAGSRIHIGSMLYNTGLCYFVAGDFETAYRFIAEAGIEDEADGRGSRFKIIIGNHTISNEIIIKPVSNWLDYHADCSESYQASTGRLLDETELFQLAMALCAHPDNAIQFLTAAHRFIKTYSGPENYATRHTRIRTLGDLLIGMESSLRLQHRNFVGQLSNRLEKVLTFHSSIQKWFLELQREFQAKFPAQNEREETIALNWIVNRIDRLGTLLPKEQRLGYAIFACLVLRNHLLHKIDNALVFFEDRLMTARLFGMILAVQSFILRS